MSKGYGRGNGSMVAGKASGSAVKMPPKTLSSRNGVDGSGKAGTASKGAPGHTSGAGTGAGKGL